MKTIVPYLRHISDKFNHFLVTQNEVPSGKRAATQAATLRLEIPLKSGESTYDLNIMSNTSSDRPNEIKLGEGEHMALTHIGIGLTKTKADGSTNELVHTYPSLQLFSVEAQRALSLVYNGTVQVKTPNQSLTPKLATIHNLFNAGIDSNSNDNGETVMPIFGADIEERGFQQLVNPVFLNGSVQQTVQVKLGAGDKTDIEHGVDENVLVVFLHGIYYNGIVEGTSPGTCRQI